MSKLIQLRQRNKAIDTIQKITHAMRLISMSTHAHLQQLYPVITHYVHELDKMFYHLLTYAPGWYNPILHGSPDYRKEAVIIVGSQKGLCGSFNSQLFKLVTHHINEQAGEQFDRIVIGSYDEKSKTALRELYKTFRCPIVETSLSAAEMIKYASNAFLATKISFINEIGFVERNSLSPLVFLFFEMLSLYSEFTISDSEK
jgi:ATP synthase F1 gamma subunit